MNYYLVDLDELKAVYNSEHDITIKHEILAVILQREQLLKEGFSE